MWPALRRSARVAGIWLGTLGAVLLLPSHVYAVEPGSGPADGSSSAGPVVASAPAWGSSQGSQFSRPVSVPSRSSVSRSSLSSAGARLPLEDPPAPEPSPTAAPTFVPAAAGVSVEWVQERDAALIVAAGLVVLLLGVHVVGSWGR